MKGCGGERRAWNGIRYKRKKEARKPSSSTVKRLSSPSVQEAQRHGAFNQRAKVRHFGDAHKGMHAKRDGGLVMQGQVRRVPRVEEERQSQDEGIHLLRSVRAVQGAAGGRRRFAPHSFHVLLTRHPTSPHPRHSTICHPLMGLTKVRNKASAAHSPCAAVRFPPLFIIFATVKLITDGY